MADISPRYPLLPMLLSAVAAGAITYGVTASKSGSNESALAEQNKQLAAELDGAQQQLALAQQQYKAVQQLADQSTVLVSSLHYNLVETQRQLDEQQIQNQQLLTNYQHLRTRHDEMTNQQSRDGAAQRSAITTISNSQQYLQQQLLEMQLRVAQLQADNDTLRNQRTYLPYRSTSRYGYNVYPYFRLDSGNDRRSDSGERDGDRPHHRDDNQPNGVDPGKLLHRER